VHSLGRMDFVCLLGVADSGDLVNRTRLIGFFIIDEHYLGRLIISKKILCARCTAVASGYQVCSLCTLDIRCAWRWVATFACIRCVRRHGCHLDLPLLDTSGYTTLYLMHPDTAHNTIAPSDSLLIHPTSRVPLDY